MTGECARADRYAHEYAATLAASLRGPASAKARLVEEIRAGFADTLASYRAAGSTLDEAVRHAVDEFGSAEELAPSCQRELTVAQTRRTAGTLALAAPLLLGGWHLLWVGGPATGPAPGPARAAFALAVALAALTAAGAVVAALALLATGPLARRMPVPDRLPLATAWTASTVGVAMIVATLSLTTATLTAATLTGAGVTGAGLTGTAGWLVIAVIVALTLGAHIAVAASARACRRCACPPTTR